MEGLYFIFKHLKIHLPIAQQSFYWHIFEVIWVFIPNPEPAIWILELGSGCSVTTNRKPCSGQVVGEQVGGQVGGAQPTPFSTHIYSRRPAALFTFKGHSGGKYSISGSTDLEW